MTVHQWAPVLLGIAVALFSTWLLLIAALAIRISIPMRKRLQLDAAYRRFSSSSALPGGDERLRLQLLVIAVLMILSLVSLGLMLVRAESTSAQGAPPGGLWSGRSPSPASESRITPPSTTTPGAGGNSGSGSAKETIQLQDLAHSARPFQTVRIQGRYHGGADTFLQVQRWEAGKWLAFPVPTKTDQSGQFTTHVEFDMTPPVVRRWLSLGLIPEPPWTLRQLQEVRGFGMCGTTPATSDPPPRTAH